MKSKTEQIAELQKKNSRLEDLLARKKVLHQDDYDKMLLLDSEWNRLNKECNNLREELEILKTLHEEYKVKSDKYESKIEQLKKSNDNVSKMYDATHKLYMEEKRLNKQRAEHYSLLSKREDDWIKQLSKLKERIGELEQTNSRLKDIYETLLLSMGAVERKLLEEKNKNRTLENELSLTIDANTKLKERIGELELLKIELKEMSIWEFIKWRKTY